jgi:hypothetical protein
MIRLALLVAALAACGSPRTTGVDPDSSITADARFPSSCVTPDLTKPACSNCVDDDGDGAVDGFDLHCSGPLDDDETSFATGIPGDNIDAVKQDCFFDGDSGAGNDGCDIHVCCLLGITDAAACPISASTYDPAACPPPIGTGTLADRCRTTCGALTPPGCDCFGCCTLCDPADPTSCHDIITNPNTSPECTAETLGDPDKCTPCTQVPSCGPSDCGGATCILCPGQDPSSLPPECNATPQCPVGSSTCSADAECGEGSYCSTGECCVGIVL